MTVIVGFVSQKGGVGKSTLSRALGAIAATNDWDVRIADLDPDQGTTAKWNDRRKDRDIEPELDVRRYEATSEALKFADDLHLLIIDGPARTSMGTLAIANKSDVVVQPTNGHLDDLVPGVHVFNELVREGIAREKLRFALCRIGTPAEEARAREYLMEAGFDVLDGALYEKPAYGQAQDKGWAVTETRYDKLNDTADSLIESLLDAVIKQDEEKQGTTTKASAA